MRRLLSLLVATTSLFACGGPSPKENRVRIDAAKAVVEQTLGTYRPASAKDSLMESLAIKKTLPRRIEGLMLRSDVGVALDIADADAVVVEALYGVGTPNARVLIVDIATGDDLAAHVEGEAFAGGELVQHDDEHLTYVAKGRFLVDISAEGLGKEQLRTALKTIDLGRLAELSGGG